MSESYQIIDLDVRPYLKKKLEPFEVIMDTVKSLKKDEWMRLHATFKPTPLLGVMRVKGYVNKVEKLEADHWVVTFAPKKWAKELGQGETGSDESTLKTTSSAATAIQGGDSVASASASPSQVGANASQVYHLDNRGLEPPQPMIRTLGQLDRAHPGDQVIIHNDRVPVFLLEELNQLGYTYDIDEQDDGSAKVKIIKST